MMSGLREAGRHRVLKVGVWLSVGAALAFRLLWVGPQRDLLAIRRMELEQRRAEVARARLAASRLPRLEADAARLRRRFEVLRETVPGPREASALLRRLQGMAGRSRLTMQSFTVDAARVREHYVEWPVRMELTGGFHDLAAFLDEVSRLPLIVNIEELSIRALPSGSGASTIAVTCTAVTYVLGESVAVEAAAVVEGDGR